MIAEVIVDISNSEVDRVFDYSLEGSPEIRAGFRVLVPFGRQTVEGYVIRLKESSDFVGLKAVIKALDDCQVISDEMLSLMDYMTDRYHLRRADALRLFIPAQMRGGRVKELKVKYAEIADEYRGRDETEFIRPSAKAQLDLYYHLSECGCDSVAELNKNFSAAALRNLIARGIVTTREEEELRTPYSSLTSEAKSGVVLTVAQSEVADRVRSGGGEIYLLHGVTGSGKTEVYHALYFRRACHG